MTCNLVCKNNTATQFEEAIGYLDVNEKVVLESDDIFPSYCLANHFSDTLRTETMAIVQLILLNLSGPKRQRSVPSAFVWSARVCCAYLCAYKIEEEFMASRAKKNWERRLCILFF